MKLIKDFSLLDLSDYENIGIYLPIGAIIIGFCVVMIAFAFYYHYYRSSVSVICTRLLRADAISEEKHAEYVGRTVRCLVDGLCDDPRWDLTARTPGNRLVRLTGDTNAVGAFRDVKITDSNTWSLTGQLA